MTRTAPSSILREVAIDAHHPGSILRDFAMLLEYVAEAPPPLTTGLLLPLSEPPRLNARLAHPIRVDLQRPQQKSFPHVNGLFLLLRTSALAQTRYDGKHHRLILDSELLGQWHALNATERYFALLECWLVEADARLVGEPGDLGCFPRCGGFVEFNRRSKVLRFSGYREQDRRLNYSPGYLNLALMELFGLARLEHGDPEPGKGWRVLSAGLTPLGDALFAELLSRHDLFYGFRDAPEPGQLALGDEGGEVPALDALHRIFRPWFPGLKQALSRPGWAFRPGSYRFKVSLGTRVWRRIAVPGEERWDALADEILDAFSFDHDHLYGFRVSLPTGQTTEIVCPAMGEGRFADEVRIGEVPLQPGDVVSFVYDFGDQWQFTLVLEEIGPEDPSLSGAVLLESHGKAPEQYPDGEEW